MHIAKFLCVLITSLSAGASFAANTQVADFALLDHTGKFHQASYYSDHDAIVILVESSQTLADKRGRSALSNITALEQKDKVKIMLLSPVANELRADLQAAINNSGHQLPALMDETQLVMQSLGLTQYGEVIVIDPETMNVLYQGDSTPLQSIADLDSVTPTRDALGSAITLRTPEPVSYSTDIAPILERNCVSCHRDGGIGPWSMSSHAMVRGWSPMMREVVMTHRMPPGRIDAHVGKPMRNAGGLSVSEQQMLIDWIDQGAEKDLGADPLAELTFGTAAFTLGEPDIVLDVTPQEIPATGVVDYRYIPVPLNLPEDKWLRAIEFIPGDHEVLHHVITYLSSPANKSETAEDGGAGQGQNLGGFAPGRQPDEFADNSGRLIPKGSNLLLQMHYTTSGRETVDATRVGL